MGSRLDCGQGAPPPGFLVDWGLEAVCWLQIELWTEESSEYGTLRQEGPCPFVSRQNQGLATVSGSWGLVRPSLGGSKAEAQSDGGRLELPPYPGEPGVRPGKFPRYRFRPAGAGQAGRELSCSRFRTPGFGTLSFLLWSLCPQSRYGGGAAEQSPHLPSTTTPRRERLRGLR